jgi:glycosyltransferase involved in cell wall biosynthesis
MKIAYVAPYSSSYFLIANSIHIFKICDAYSSLGLNVSLYLDGLSREREVSKNYFRDFDLSSNFDVKALPFLGKFRSLKLLISVPMLLKKKRFDIIHTGNIAIAFSCTVFFKIPTVLELHNLPENNNKTHFLFRMFCRSSYSKGIITVTSSLKLDLQCKFNNLPSLFVFPDGVALKYLSGQFDKSILKKRLAFDICEKKWCVYTGSFNKGKGVEFIKKLSKTRPDLTFVLVGGNSNEYDSEFENIFFFGQRKVEDVLDFQRAADILLLPVEDVVFGAGDSARDIGKYTSPIKMFEYMASKAPIVASDLSVLKEVLRNGENAILCDLNDLELWGATLDHLLNDTLLSRSISNRAFEDVREFTWENRAKKIVRQVFKM